jgi:CrcB protein
MNFSLYALLAAGGALGTMARYFVSAALPMSKNHLSWGTILINIAGSFVIGFFGTLTLAHGRYPLSENMRLFIMVGFCGGFTTFSSFSLQTFDLLRGGQVARGLINIFLSVALCLCAVAVGHMIAAHFNGGAAQIAQIPMEEEA